MVQAQRRGGYEALGLRGSGWYSRDVILYGIRNVGICYSTRAFLTLLYLQAVPYQFDSMRIPKCNHQVTEEMILKSWMAVKS